MKAMLKKGFRYFLLTVILLSSALPRALADYNPKYDTPPILNESDMQQNDALQKAAEVVEEKFGVNSQDLLQSWNPVAKFDWNNLLYEDDCVWTVTFHMETPKIWQYEAIFSRDGELLWVKGWDTIYYKPDFKVLDEAKIATPTQNDATEEQVIVTARLNLPEMSEYTAEEANNLNVKAYFIFHKAFCMGDAPVWYIQFFDHETMVHEMLLSYDGEVMDSLPKAGMLFYNVQLPQENMEDALQINFSTSGFWEASVEKKAKLYNEWKPLVDAYLRDHPYMNKNNLLYAATDHVYSVPGENHITLEQATKIAREAAIALGANEGTFEKRNIEYFFDATDPLTPVWKLVIFYAKVPIEELGENHNLANYRVIIDAETGEVQEAFEVPDDMDLIDWRF